MAKMLPTFDVLSILDAPMSEWQDRVDANRGRCALGVLASQATDLCVRAARLAAYLDELASYPSDESGAHDAAVAEQNETARKIRKALGFARPRFDLQF